MFPTPGQYSREANERIDAHADDARYQRMNTLELLWTGKGYTARPSFWDATVPLRERQPALQTMFPRTVGRRLVSMVFGERTAPAIAVMPTSFGVTLTDAESQSVSALVQEILTAGHVVSRMRTVMEAGLKCGSACILVGIVEGKPRVTIEPAKHCYPTLDDCGRVTRLVVTYRVPMDDTREGWYRREIGDGIDRVYAVQQCEDRKRPDWAAAKVESEHAIPFVPVVWVRNLAEAEEESRGVDGHALIDGLESEVFALDMNVSMLFRNALYNTDPQLVQTGVDSGTGTGAPQGRTAGAGVFGDAAEWARGWLSRLGGGQPAAKRGPGQVWKLPQGSDAKMLESSGAGAEIAKGSITEIRRVLTDALGVVLTDPQVLGRGDISAKALEIMLGPMLDTVGVLRVEYGGALVSVVDMVLRLCADPTIGRGVYLATLAEALPVLTRLHMAREDGATSWVGAPLTLAWPDIVKPSWSDISAAIDAASKATGGRAVLSQRAALRLVAPAVGVDDLDAEAESLEQELGGDTAAMRDALGALAPKPDAPAAAPVEAVQDTALNGAQVEALVSLAEKVTARMIPLESAVRIAMRGFQLAEADAREMLAPAAQMAAPSTAAPPAPPAPVEPGA